jgi:hypothetical protein
MKLPTKTDVERAFDLIWSNALVQVTSRNYKAMPKALQLAADMAKLLAEFHEPKPKAKNSKKRKKP